MCDPFCMEGGEVSLLVRHYLNNIKSGRVIQLVGYQIRASILDHQLYKVHQLVRVLDKQKMLTFGLKFWGDTKKDQYTKSVFVAKFYILQHNRFIVFGNVKLLLPNVIQSCVDNVFCSVDPQQFGNYASAHLLLWVYINIFVFMIVIIFLLLLSILSPLPLLLLHVVACPVGRGLKTKS